MTPPEPPRPDPDPSGDDLAGLYRQAAREEPPPRHDAAILAAAAADLARPADRAGSRPGWWQRWRVGLSLAATVLLSAGLVLLVGREQAQDTAPPAPATESAAPARESAQESVRPQPSTELRQAPAAPPASPPDRSAEPRRDAPAPAAPSRQEADNYAVPATPAAKAKAEAPAASAPAAPAPFPAPGEARRDAERPAAGSVAREAAEATPEAQLAEVRALRQAGREEEARTALAAFLRRHPNYPLPADLETLDPPPR